MCNIGFKSYYPTYITPSNSSNCDNCDNCDSCDICDSYVTYTNTYCCGVYTEDKKNEKPKKVYSVIKQKKLINKMSINKKPHRIVKRNYLTSL